MKKDGSAVTLGYILAITLQKICIVVLHKCNRFIYYNFEAYEEEEAGYENDILARNCH